MKNMILMGVLLLSGLAFSLDLGGGTVYGQMYRMTGCQYDQAYDLVSDAYNNYGYYVPGDGCYGFDFEGLLIDLDATMSDVDSDFISVLVACGDGGAGTQECASAKQQFYSTAASARGMFRSAMATYRQAARQAVWSYGYTDGGCGNGRGEILDDMLGEAQDFRMCMGGGLPPVVITT